MPSNEICYDKCTEYHTEVFPTGITNGASWYSIYGGMQDWLYEHTSQFEITVEMGCNQYPPASAMPQYWQLNKRSLLNYIKEVHRGIKGIVSDESTGSALAHVNVHVLNRAHNVSSSEHGEYYRLLLPGPYEIIFEHKDYKPERLYVMVLNTMAQIHNIKLRPLRAANETGAGGTSATTKPTDSANRPPPDGAQDNDDHSIVVATLIMTIIIILILLLMAGAYVIQKRRRTRSQSMSVELQNRSAGTGISLPIAHQSIGTGGGGGGQLSGQLSSGSSTNPHLSA